MQRMRHTGHAATLPTRAEQFATVLRNFLEGLF